MNAPPPTDPPGPPPSVPPPAARPRSSRPPLDPAAPIRRSQRLALSVLLALTFYGAARVAAPLWVGIAFGTVMAFATQSVHLGLAGRLGGRPRLASALTTLVTALLSVAATAGVAYVLGRDLVTLAGLVRAAVADVSLGDLVEGRGGVWIRMLRLDPARVTDEIRRHLGAVAQYAATAGGELVQSTASVALGMVLGLAVAVMTMYYVLIEWARIAARLERVLPLDPRHTRALVVEFRDVGRSAFVGSVATAGVQGVLGALGCALAGAPHAVTLGLLTALASFLPAVGTALVWLPVAAYLAFVGRTGAAVFELAWGAVVVIGVADYVIRPRLVGARGEGHPLLMLVGLLGGLEVFGLAGLLVGPVLMALFVATLRIYERQAD